MVVVVVSGDVGTFALGPIPPVTVPTKPYFSERQTGKLILQQPISLGAVQEQPVREWAW